MPLSSSRSRRRRDPYRSIQDTIFGELKGDAPEIAKALGLTGAGPDVVRLTDEETDQHIRDNWDNPEFRKKLAERYMGPLGGPNGLVPAAGRKAFETAVLRAFAPMGGYAPPPPAPGPVPPTPGPAGTFPAPDGSQGVAPPNGGQGPIPPPPGPPPPEGSVPQLPPEGVAPGEVVYDPFSAPPPGYLPPPPMGAFGMAPPMGAPGTIGPVPPPPPR